jgi:putative peptide zinc metalloprotease protein
MTTLRRATLTATVTLAAVAALPTTPAYADGRPDNVVTSIADSQRTVVEHSRVRVAQYPETGNGNTNLAQAYSHDCSGCRAVAVAFQAVLVPGSPRSFTPTNAAVAVNERCSGCTTFAFAYQYVVQTHGITDLSERGLEAISAIRHQVDVVTESGAAPAALDADLKRLEVAFRDAVNNDLASRGDHVHGDDNEHSRKG